MFHYTNTLPPIGITGTHIELKEMGREGADDKIGKEAMGKTMARRKGKEEKGMEGNGRENSLLQFEIL